MKNIGNILKQAQAMQTRMAEMQAELGSLEIKGTSGAGLVEVTLSGKGELRRVKLQPSVVSPLEIEVLEDLIVAAFNEAKQKMDSHVQAETEKMMGGLGLPPGMKLPF